MSSGLFLECFYINLRRLVHATWVVHRVGVITLVEVSLVGVALIMVVPIGCTIDMAAAIRVRIWIWCGLIFIRMRKVPTMVLWMSMGASGSVRHRTMIIAVGSRRRWDVGGLCLMILMIILVIPS